MTVNGPITFGKALFKIIVVLEKTDKIDQPDYCAPTSKHGSGWPPRPVAHRMTMYDSLKKHFFKSEGMW